MVKGSKMSLEAREKMRNSHIGLKKSIETIEKLRIALLGHKITEETKRKISASRKGQRISLETRKKMSLVRKRDRERNHLWKGGITEINQAIRTSFEYKIWREAIFKRDDYTCVLCGKVGGELNADHIKSFAKYVESRFDMNNGRTLCILCHRETSTYAIHLRTVKTSI